MNKRTIPLHELSEKDFRPIDQQLRSSAKSDDTLDRYDEALKKPSADRTHADWVLMVAMEEAAPDLADGRPDQTNYYSGENDVPQVMPMLQGGSVNQS